MSIDAIRERMDHQDCQDLLDLQEIWYDLLHHVISSHDPCVYRDQLALNQER